MSSTDEARLARRLHRFFDERVLPASRAARERRGELFERHPDPARESYWLERPRRAMRREDFELAGLESPEHLGRALAALWKARDMPELAALAGELGELAGDLRQTEQEADEVSPFIYVMF